MAREPILHSDHEEPEVEPLANLEDDRDLRPQRIRDMIGQRDVIARLDIALDAARSAANR